jgi:hypothetical protein
MTGERFLLIEWIKGNPVIDGAEYADTRKELMDYCDSLPKVSGVEYTICRIYDVRNAMFIDERAEICKRNDHWKECVTWNNDCRCIKSCDLHTK